MSRRHAQSGPTISLFPFLAVLLCTMGSLLVLLVIFSRSAQQADATAEAAAAAAAAEELQLAREELGWRIDQLAGVKARTEEDLARVRMQLAGIEEDARALADEFDALEQTAAALEEGVESEAEPLADLEQQLAEAERELAEAREHAADRPPAYAVVPYEGEAGTHRRPLYIECCIDGVFLQPEGVRLGPADFEGPPGPGNPLASGLRAAREYLARQAGESGDPAAQPYPLLLVRPSGVMAYYAARESLQSWGSDFGYQFVDEDWELTYPPADPVLADIEGRAVAEARRRLEWLAQVRPPKRSRPAVQYRAATTRGGVVASGGPSVLGDQSQWDWTEEQAQAGRPGRGFRAGGDEGAARAGGGDAILGAAGGGDAEGDQWLQAGSGPAGGVGPGSGGDGTGGLGDRYRGPSKFYGGGGGDAAGGGGQAEGALAGDGQPGGSEFGGDGDGGRAPGGTAGASGEGSGNGLEPGGHGGDGDASALAAGGGGAGAGNAGGSGGGGAGQAAGQTAGQGGGGGSFGASIPGMPQAGASATGASGGSAECSGGSCSVASRRGSNWASLASHERPIPLTRPIRLECAASEFRILGTGGRVERRVRIDGDTINAVDPLVREIHATVGGWGMAGDRMYWKPELVLSATPDGTGRRDDLEQLLADSGLDTRRSGRGEQVRRLPPVNRTGGLFPPR